METGFEQFGNENGGGRESDFVAVRRYGIENGPIVDDAVSGGTPDGGSGSVRRGRGRPRKAPSDEVETDDILSGIKADAPRRRRTPQSGFSESDLLNILTFVFNVLAQTRGPHWQKSPEELKLLSEPLSRYIKTLSVTAGNNVSKYALPCMILLAMFAVLQEPIKYELEINSIKRSQRQGSISNANGTGHKTKTPSTSDSVNNGRPSDSVKNGYPEWTNTTASSFFTIVDTE